MAKISKSRKVTYVRSPAPPTELPFCIHRAGRQKFAEYHSSRGTYFDDVTINLIAAGKGYYYKDKVEYPLSQGFIVIATPGEDTGFIFADKHDPYDIYYCRFNGGEAKKMANRILDEKSKAHPVFYYNDWKNLLEQFRIILGLWNSNPTIATDRMRPVDCKLGVLLASLDSSQFDFMPELTAETLKLYLHDHINQPADLAKIAEAFGITKNHLCRVSKNILGDTIINVWEEMKVEYAKELIQSTPLRISELARLVGYPDPLYFSKVFKKRTGLSPAKWRSKTDD